MHGQALFFFFHSEFDWASSAWLNDLYLEIKGLGTQKSVCTIPIHVNMSDVLYLYQSLLPAYSIEAHPNSSSVVSVKLSWPWAKFPWTITEWLSQPVAALRVESQSAFMQYHPPSVHGLTFTTIPQLMVLCTGSKFQEPCLRESYQLQAISCCVSPGTHHTAPKNLCGSSLYFTRTCTRRRIDLWYSHILISYRILGNF